MGHPLDPLSAEEITAAAQACKNFASSTLGRAVRFNVVSLKEPTKAALLAYELDGSNVPAREAFCILQVPPETSVYEVCVQLDKTGASVLGSKKLEGVQPVATPDDCFDAEAICKADPEVQKLLRERYGVEDLDMVACDPWSVHLAPVEGRLIQLFMYLRSSPDDNHYAHPLDMVTVVDLLKGKVVHIDKYDKTPAVPRRDVNYHRKLYDGTWRSDIKQLDVVQPEGPSFSIDGNLVKWQKWQFRVGFNYREGLVLHNVGYEDSGRVRPILHRASLVEMAVPYAEPRTPYTRKCAFDVGDYGLGYCTFPLTLGCDCLGHIKYFGAVLCNSKGEPQEVPHAVCMHEEDVGLLWKHVEWRNGMSESRRSRRLVISFIATVVNYEYCFYWYLYQDGTIQYEIKLTGELSTNLLSPGEADPEYGVLVGDGVNAQHHQHLFCARLDFAVDDPQGGRSLLVTEVDVEPDADGPANPEHNAFHTVETKLTNTTVAQRLAAPQKARFWKIKNPHSLHPVTKQPVAFKLVAANTPPILAGPKSSVARRAVFASRHLWVTPHDDEQRFPAGDYVMMGTDCEGLSQWTKEELSLVDADPVVWHAFGVTHVVRPEDFPVMPVEHVGFTIKPYGFFDGNPGVDIPAGINTGSKLCCIGSTNGATNGTTVGAH